MDGLEPFPLEEECLDRANVVDKGREVVGPGPQEPQREQAAKARQDMELLQLFRARLPETGNHSSLPGSVVRQISTRSLRYIVELVVIPMGEADHVET